MPTASLEKKPQQKEKDKKKKRKSSTEDDEAAKLRAELEASRGDRGALTAAGARKKKRKKDKKGEGRRRSPRRRRRKAPADTDAPPRARLRRRPALRRHGRKCSEYFETLCGDLEKVEIQCFEDNPERCCGIAYVTFVEPDSLDRALTLDGESFKGDRRTMKIRRIARATNRGGRRRLELLEVSPSTWATCPGPLPKKRWRRC